MRRLFYALLLPVILLSACGRGEVVQPYTPTPFVPSHSATATAQAQRAAEAAAATDEATAVVVSGDPARGEALFHTFEAEANFACSTCHRTDSEEQLIGPGLKGIGQRAATRVPGETAIEYIHTSIVDPSAFVVPNYPDNLMPKVFGDIFTEDQINDLIAYLMTL
ncbi:MAG: cytochrome c [Anaerolineae bacterium]|nr:cytochrome c [Anaerolineae bacterium]